MFQGVLTALITPFKEGRIDFDRLATNIEFQIQHGVDGVVPVGTTGESPTLSHDEHRQVVERVVEVSKGRIKVLAGTGSNSTSEALSLTKHAKEMGADGALLVNPYYNKPTQEGLYRHFAMVADEGELPIVLYNIPGRTAVTLSAATIGRLAEHEKIVGIKEATGSLDMASEIASMCDTTSFTILSGDDSLTLPLISVGAQGVISVLSNLLPANIKALADTARAGDMEPARRLHLEMFGLFKALFIETNPIPIKTAMALCGKDSGELRLPMCKMADSNHAKLKGILKQHRILT